MSTVRYVAPARSWKSVDQVAWRVRATFGLTDKPFFPVMEFLEEVLVDQMELVSLEVWPDVECQGAEGFTSLDGKYLALPESVYRRACTNMPRDRFTVAHELGHLFLHVGAPLQRATSGSNVPPYREP